MINKTLIILAGGFGTRLKSILKDKPKPLADINGKPFLFYLFQNWVNCGFSDFVLSLHYQANDIVEFTEELKSSILNNCKVRYVIESKPLGTGGAISNVLSNIEISDYFFVANADTWIENGFDSIDAKNESCIAVVNVSDSKRFGKVLLDSDGFITDFIEKNEQEQPSLINAGVYLLSKENFSIWDGEPYSIENDLFPSLVSRKLLKGEIINSDFVDIGVPDDYYKFCKLNKD